MSRYPRIYAALKRLGFSPAKALEIVIDARRGDDHALTFVQIAFCTRRS